MVPELLSPSNPRLRRLRRLVRDPRLRRQQQLMVVEGPRALSTVLGAGAELVELYVGVEGEETDSALLPDGLLADQRLPRVQRVARAVLDSISDSDTPQGLLALARPRLVELRDLDPESAVVVVDGVQDPGNLGAIVRVAAAMGVGSVVTTSGTADPLSPRAVRASAGTMALVSLCLRHRPAAILESFREHGRRVLVADTSGVAIAALPAGAVVEPWALVLGSEGRGVGEGFRTGGVTTISVPMAEGVESLNVAVTAGIVLYSLRYRG